MAELKKIRIAVLGASGYTGGETLRLAARHPNIDVLALTAERYAGVAIDEIFPHLGGLALPSPTKIDDLNLDEVDAVFCCLPHGTTQEVVKLLPRDLKVVDLSADFRLGDPEVYAAWYGHKHFAPELQADVAYGLTELNRETIVRKRIVACPGCYPTAALLPLAPIVTAEHILTDEIIIDAKSGVSGAGRAVKQEMLFAEISEGIHAYGIGEHRHGPEIDQELSIAAGKPVVANFTPHLVPMNRGILSTVYVKLSGGVTTSDLRKTLIEQYDNEPCVHVVPENVSPSTRHVRGSNQCLIGIFEDRIPGRAILVSVIDNMVKGAAGQAIQNFNLMFGLPETAGLQQAPLFP